MRENNQWSPPAWAGEPSAGQAPPEEHFTLPAQEIPRELWSTAEPHHAEKPRRKRVREPRKLHFALPVIIFLGFLSAFFSWVSAEPLWLAAGHSIEGTATVTRCVGDGMTRRCLGDFSTHDYTIAQISLLGLTDTLAVPGQQVAAEMVNARSHRAYAGGTFLLRWLLGLALVLLCGLGIALAAGVGRFADRQERRAAFTISLAAPMLVTLGFLAAAY